MPGIDTGGAQRFGGGTHRSWGDADANQMVARLGLDAGLEIALDPGDSSSYSGSGQTYVDLSGNGVDFDRGATSGSAADDPTFVGSAGDLSDGEYWDVDSGELFEISSGNTTEINDIHQNSAACTIIQWVRFGSLTTNQGLFGTASNSANNVGVTCFVNNAGSLGFQIRKGSAPNAFGQGTVEFLSSGRWELVGIIVDEANDIFRVVHNSGLVTDEACTYSSPSAGSATYDMQINAGGNGAPDSDDNCNSGPWLFFSRALSVGEVWSYFELMRRRWRV